MMQEELTIFMCYKLADVRKAVYELLQQTVPYTPLPCFKFFKFFDKHAEIVWPGCEDLQVINGIYIVEELYTVEEWFTITDAVESLYALKVKGKNYWIRFDIEIENTAQKLCKLFCYQPARILRVSRWLESVIEWCKKRTEGRKRAAEEILRQQKKAVDVLISMSVAHKLSGASQ